MFEMRLWSAAVLLVAPCFAQIPSGIRFQQGPVNSVIIGRDLAVYGADTGVSRVLLTSARRDSIGTIPARAVVMVPGTEKHLLTNPQAFWAELENARFHDYAQKSTKVPIRAMPKAEALADGAEIASSAVKVRAIATPGYTSGGMSYVLDTGGKRLVCTGDLIYGDGQIRDLYSLQDAVPEAKARGYHGYAARAGDLIASLRKVAALKPDILLPAHGPAVTDPQRSILRLIERLQTFLQSHFETDALRWYWGDDNHRIRSRAVEREMNVMPMGEIAKLPPDIVAIGNSRLIVSKTGAAFLVDAGYRKLLPELEQMRASGRVRTVDGVWITHYHDDHTDYVNDIVAAFRSPVYFTRAMAEIIGNPAGFRLPCLTTRPIPVQNAKADGETLRWHEWEFTFWNFPGQTLYHGGLLARHDDGRSYLFVGDSFTPSGMDDYCMQNRVFLRKGEGYDYCLRKIATLPSKTWLLNQHVEPMFRYSAPQIERMTAELGKRSEALREMTPWPDINYMVDESWARMYPYGQTAKAGSVVRVALRITNHAPTATTYRVRWNVPDGWQPVSATKSRRIAPHADGAIEAEFKVSTPGLHVLTADVSFGSWHLTQWAEALVRVE